MKKDLKKLVLEKLKQVMDPEIKISVVDLGLIYDVSEPKKGEVKIKMTLTSIGCPLFPLIEQEIKKKLSEIEGIKKVEVKLVFDPPWNPGMLSEKAKAKLGIFK